MTEEDQYLFNELRDWPHSAHCDVIYFRLRLQICTMVEKQV